jgi:hypothetical protein
MTLIKITIISAIIALSSISFADECTHGDKSSRDAQTAAKVNQNHQSQNNQQSASSQGSGQK